MKYDAKQKQIDRFPTRKNPRLKNFDYSSCHYNFVTICTKDRLCLFGLPGEYTAFGKIACECLEQVSAHYPNIALDKWVVMPNHIHVILVLNGRETRLPTVIGAYKSAVTKLAHKISPNIQIWQPSFYDHVIRNQADYERIWAYIDTNPVRWTDDCYYVLDDEQITTCSAGS